MNIHSPDVAQRAALYLRVSGERGDIIKRLHKSLARDGASRAHRPGRLKAKPTSNP